MCSLMGKLWATCRRLWETSTSQIGYDQKGKRFHINIQHSRGATDTNSSVWWLSGTVRSWCHSYLELVRSGWVRKRIKSMWRATLIFSRSPQTCFQTGQTGQQVLDEPEAWYCVRDPVWLRCCPPAVSLCLGTCGHSSRTERTNLGAQNRVVAAWRDRRNSVKQIYFTLQICPKFHKSCGLVTCAPINETVWVGFCSFLDATQLNESRLSPNTVRFRCTCVKSTDTSYFFIVTLRPWDAVFVFFFFFYLKLQLPCRCPQSSGYSFSKAGNRLFLESFMERSTREGAYPP